MTLVIGDTAVDVEKASSGEFASDPQAIYERWSDFTTWAGRADLSPGDPFDPAELRSPAQAPRRVLAVGLNYSELRPLAICPDAPSAWSRNGHRTCATSSMSRSGSAR